MAIDPDVRELLNALVTGRVQQQQTLERHEEILGKLAEGQVHHEALLVKLAEGQVRHEALLMKLAEGQAIAHERMDRDFKLVHERMDRDFKLVHERMDRHDERMKDLTEAIIRGFTNGIKRDDDLDGRVTALEKERGS